MASFKTVAVAGKGQLGNFIVSELTKAGFNVTVLTRSKSSHQDVAASVEIAEVDYSSIASLTEALKGHDVVIATLAMDALSIQHNLLEAALRAGVKRFIPSEYSGITLDPYMSRFPPLALVMDVQTKVKSAAEEGKIEYTIVAPGGFLNLMFNQPIMLDWENRTANLYDGGQAKVSVSRLSTIAQAIRAVLQKGEAYKNRIIKVHDCVVSQRQILEIAKDEKPDVEWKETNVDVNALVEDGLKKLGEGKGSPEVIGAMMVAKSLSRDVHFGWTEDELENANLGLDGLAAADVDALIRRRAQGELIDLPKVYEGAWKIDMK